MIVIVVVEFYSLIFIVAVFVFLRATYRVVTIIITIIIIVIREQLPLSSGLPLIIVPRTKPLVHPAISPPPPTRATELYPGGGGTQWYKLSQLPSWPFPHPGQALCHSLA